MKLAIAEAAFRLAECPDFDIWVPSKDRSLSVKYRVKRITPEFDDEEHGGAWEIVREDGRLFHYVRWNTLRHIARMVGVRELGAGNELLIFTRGFNTMLAVVLWRTTMAGWPR